MQEKQAGEVGVLDAEGKLLGYISRENLAEFMMIEDAEAQSAASTGPWKDKPAS
jgi:hypothetical protein